MHYPQPSNKNYDKQCWIMFQRKDLYQSHPLTRLSLRYNLAPPEDLKGYVSDPVEAPTKKNQ